VFEKPLGGWSDKTEDAKLTASDADQYDYFGPSVAISGGTVVVGATSDDCAGGGNACGAAYVFEEPLGGWSDKTEDAKLTASDAAELDYFGSSVAISGDTVVVGALGDDCAGGSDCGAAYLFGRIQPCEKGDVSCDGVIDLIDVRLCTQIAQGIISGTAQQRTAADGDGDGDVDMDDVAILSEYVLGIRPTLP